MSSLSECFVLGGKEAVDVIRDRLRRPGSDLDTRDMSLLLLRIQQAGTYDVRGDTEVMALIAKRIGGMKSVWKETASGFANAIAATPLETPIPAAHC
jgi:hypothetical protein